LGWPTARLIASHTKFCLCSGVVNFAVCRIFRLRIVPCWTTIQNPLAKRNDSKSSGKNDPNGTQIPCISHLILLVLRCIYIILYNSIVLYSILKFKIESPIGDRCSFAHFGLSSTTPQACLLAPAMYSPVPDLRSPWKLLRQARDSFLF
jgi:hypothetical protein